MKLEDQVCSLELAKRLKELSVKQESLFVWAKSRQSAFPDPLILYFDQLAEFQRQPPAFQVDVICFAFTVAELGEMLPYAIKSFRVGMVWHCVQMTTMDDPQPAIGLNAPTEADARAKMLIYLIENKLLKV